MQESQFTLINRLSEIVNESSQNEEIKKITNSILQIQKFKNILAKSFCDKTLYEKVTSYLKSQFNINDCQITLTQKGETISLYETGEISEYNYTYTKIFEENISIHVAIGNSELNGFDKMTLNSFFKEVMYLIYIHFIYANLQNSTASDPLTGFTTRLSFNQEMKTVIPLALREKMNIGFLLINIDRFTAVNDEHGNEFGDEFLKLYAKTIQNLIRSSDIGVRFGGGEFLVLLMHVESEDKTIEIADKIREELEQTYLISPNGDQFRKTVTIGVAMFPEDSLEVEEVINNAKIALTDALAVGRNSILRYTPSKKSTIELF